jgi:putative DNA-invertase from lambdoid prophage Rac
MILGYVRVSTEAQRENTSPEEQERVLRGYAQMKGARSFDVQIFSDCISGSTALVDRPAGRDLLDTAKKGDVIVAVKLDRLFRSACDALAVAQRFKDRGVDLVLTDMGNDPVTQNGPAKLFFTILAGVAEFERERIAERITTGKRAKMVNGGHPGGIAPFGTVVVGTGRDAVRKEHPGEQTVIRAVRELSASLRPVDVTRALNKGGNRNRAGNEFQVVQVQRMLQRG